MIYHIHTNVCARARARLCVVCCQCEPDVRYQMNMRSDINDWGRFISTNARIYLYEPLDSLFFSSFSFTRQLYEGDNYRARNGTRDCYHVHATCCTLAYARATRSSRCLSFSFDTCVCMNQMCALFFKQYI